MIINHSLSGEIHSRLNTDTHPTTVEVTWPGQLNYTAYKTDELQQAIAYVQTMFAGCGQNDTRTLLIGGGVKATGLQAAAFIATLLQLEKAMKDEDVEDAIEIIDDDMQNPNLPPNDPPAPTQLDLAIAAFEQNPTNLTAGEMLRVAREFEAEGELDDDHWLNILADIESYLLNGV